MYIFSSFPPSCLEHCGHFCSACTDLCFVVPFASCLHACTPVCMGCVLTTHCFGLGRFQEAGVVWTVLCWFLHFCMDSSLLPAPPSTTACHHTCICLLFWDSLPPFSTLLSLPSLPSLPCLPTLGFAGFWAPACTFVFLRQDFSFCAFFLSVMDFGWYNFWGFCLFGFLFACLCFFAPGTQQHLPCLASTSLPTPLHLLLLDLLCNPGAGLLFLALPVSSTYLFGLWCFSGTGGLGS